MGNYKKSQDNKEPKTVMDNVIILLQAILGIISILSGNDEDK
ncbi:hypothetical protein [Eubacterium ramulus]